MAVGEYESWAENLGKPWNLRISAKMDILEEVGEMKRLGGEGAVFVATRDLRSIRWEAGEGGFCHDITIG